MAHSEKNRTQNVMHAFCQDEFNLERVTYVKNIDSFCVYDDVAGYFKIYTDSEFSSFVFDFVERTVDRDITPSFVENVVKLIKWKIHKKSDDILSDYLAFEDRLLNLSTFEYEDFSVDKPTFHKVNVHSEKVKDGIESAPLFSQFLDTVLVDEKMQPDPELRILVQEMLGYFLLNTIEGHAVFFLVGSGGNGKSVFLNILQAIIGHEFTSSMTIESLTTHRWSTSALVGKKVNICNEEESKYVRSDKFKALVAGDVVEAERKFGGQFFMRPTTKFIFATNNNPKFENIDDGLMRRIHIIPFNRKIDEEMKDTKLTEKLLTELPGIVGWALEGAKRLVANKFKFTGSESAKMKKVEFERNLSSALVFLSEEYEETDIDTYFITNDDLYFEYRHWCERVGRKSMNQTNFLKDISRVLKNPSFPKWVQDAGKPKRGRMLKRKEVI